MIYIEEIPSCKVVGPASLAVRSVYRAEFLPIFRACEGACFHKRDSWWEIPIVHLPYLLEELSQWDAVDLNLLAESVGSSESSLLCEADYKSAPFDYQKQGILYGISHPRWLLLDGPGLGKSLQLIYLAMELRKRGVQHCLIICGVNTLKVNWKNEIQKHSNLSCRILGERINKGGRLVVGSIEQRLSELKQPIEDFFLITNIETLRNEQIIQAIKHGPNVFDLVVVDEIHCCKNPQSQQGKNLLKLVDAPYRVGATGTLLLNSPLDAYVPMKWVGYERSTYGNYKSFYCQFTGPFNNIVAGYRHLDYLQRQLRECSLRREKSILNLPPKTIIEEFVEMSPAQERLYQEVVKGIRDSVDKVVLNTANSLALLGRLRQVTSLPSLITSSEVSSSKLERAMDLIQQVLSNQEQVVVFSSYKGVAEEVAKRIGSQAVLCTGDSSEQEISQGISDFQKGKKSVMACTWQKMGTGVTLTAAQTAVFIDTPWTPGQFEQCQDRIYRVGTSKPVFIYNLITKNTVDEQVQAILQDKQFISDFVVDGKCSSNLSDRLKQILLDIQG